MDMSLVGRQAMSGQGQLYILMTSLHTFPLDALVSQNMSTVFLNNFEGLIQN